MAKPSVESALTTEQIRTYKKLQVLGQEYADEYALTKSRENVGRVRADVLQGREPTIAAPIFKEPVSAPLPTFDVGVPSPELEEEETGVVYESPFFETERERLDREGARPPEPDEPVGEEVALPRIEPEPVFLAATPERAKAEPERIVATTTPEEREEGAPVTEEASRLQKLYAKFDDSEKSAYLKAKKELIQQGASLYEAEARAAQIVRGVISGPREILTAERIEADSPALTDDNLVNPEFYESEDVSIFSKLGAALKPQPLLSPRQVAIKEASQKRGDETKALLEEEAIKDLVAWRNGTKKFKGENYFVYFKDRVRGGIDEDKVEEWKQERFKDLVKRTQDDIKASTKRIILDNEAAKGNVIPNTDPRYKEISLQADEVVNLWTTDVAPELLPKEELKFGEGLLEAPKAGLTWALASNQELVWNSKDFTFDVKEIKGTPAFETPLKAGLRVLGGLGRGALEPLVEFLTYEVDNKGKVLDKSDWNYTIQKSMSLAWDRVEKGTASPVDYAVAYNPFGAIASTGRNIQGTAPTLNAKKFAGLPATFGMTEGTGYFEDWAFATATGRWTGNDIAEAPVIKEYYEREGLTWVPWIAGLATELLMPISSLTAFSRGVTTTSRLAAAAKFGKTAEALEGTAGFIGKPLRTTASLVGNRVGTIRLYDALTEASGLGKIPATEKVALFFQPAKLEQVVGEGVARNLANNIVRNDVFPTSGKPFPEFNTLLYKGKALNAIYETVYDVLSGGRGATTTTTGINAPINLSPELLDIASNRLAAAVYEDVAAAAMRGGVPVIGREVVLEEIQKAIKEVAQGSVPTRLQPSIQDVIINLTKVNERGSLISADILTDVDRLIAETTFNNWVLVTPTTAVKTKLWEKYGDQINKETRAILFGDATDKELAELFSREDTVSFTYSQRRRINTLLNDYLLRSGKTPTYVRNLIGKVEGGTLSIEDFNRVNDLVKSQVASTILPKAQSLVELTTTGRLSQRAAVPVVRRLTTTRAFEDLTNGVFGRVLSKGLKQYSFETLGIKLNIPRANIDLFNRVEQLSARINALPAEAQTAWRAAIANGESPASILQREIDDTFNIKEVDGNTLDYVSKAEILEDLSNLVSKFFTITDEAKLFRENYGLTIDKIITEMADAGRFTEIVDDAGVVIGHEFRMSYEVVEDVLKRLQKRFSPLQTKGLDTRVASVVRDKLSKLLDVKDKIEGILDKEGVLSLLIASSLDRRRLKLIDEFGETLAKDLPELVVGSKKVLDDINIQIKATEAGETAQRTYDAMKAKASSLNKPPRELIGNQNASGVPQYVEGWERIYNNATLRDEVTMVKPAGEITEDYVRTLLRLTAADLVKQIATKANTDIPSVIADVYQSVIRNASVEGSISVAELETKIVDKFIAEYFTSGWSDKFVAGLERAYPELNFKINVGQPLNEILIAEARSYYVTQLQSLINVNAYDLVSKLQATGIPIDIVRGDITFSDIMLKAKQLGNTKVLVDDTTYGILEQLTSNNIYVERGLEALAAKNKDVASYFGQELLNVIDDVRMRTVQGMLGGYIAPNTRFFGVNNFSAPLIAAVTNPTYVGVVAKQIPASFGKPVMEAARAVGAPRTMAGIGLTGATIGTAAAGPVGGLIGGAAGIGAGAILHKIASKSSYGFSDITPIITPSGKVINSTEFNAILSRNKWRMGQIDFEFSDRILAETVDVLKGSIRTSDTAKTTAQHLTTLSRQRNFWNTMGSEADIVFRRAVFKEALARGATEAEAANLSRNTLLDYTAVSEAERKTIARAILFYSFMRQSMAETMMAFLREPTENAILRKVIIQRASADRAAKEYGQELEDYQRSRLWVSMTSKNVEYDEKDVAFFGIDDPMLSQFNSFVGIFGLMNSYDYVNKSEADYVKGVVDWYAGKRPELAFLQDIYELSQKGKDGIYGMVPATDMAVLNQVGAMPQVINIYGIEPIDNMEIEKLKEKYGGLPTFLAGKPTYNGQYYKFSTEQGAAGFIFSKYLATIVGFQRGVYDWAQITAKANNIKNPELKRYKDGKWYLYGVGLETPMEAPDWLQVEYEIAQAQYRDLQTLKQGKGVKRITTEGE